MRTADVIFFSQCNPAWALEHLGNSPCTMHSSGCLVTCIASALSMQSVTVKGIGSPDPKTLNKAFSAAGAYDTSGNLQWNILCDAFGLKVDMPDEASPQVLDSYLASGIYPIVKIRINETGSYHYVLVTGSHEGQYQCMDPSRQDEALIPLTDYNSMLYAVRCIYQ